MTWKTEGYKPMPPGLSVTISVKVDLEELRDWDAEKVKALMNGIAMVVARSDSKIEPTPPAPGAAKGE